MDLQALNRFDKTDLSLSRCAQNLIHRRVLKNQQCTYQSAPIFDWSCF